MRLLSFALPLALAGVSLPAGAQGMQGGGPRPGVEFLLAHTGSLQLTDAQVTKLAAIARRVAERHRALRASMDSLRMRHRAGGDSSSARHRGGPPPAAFQHEREAAHTDLRDAIAVLTPEQQATAWEMVSQHHRRGFGRQRPMRGGRGMSPQRRMQGFERPDGADPGDPMAPESEPGD